MSDENPSMSQTFQKSYIMNQGKVSTGVINNELLKNIEVLEEENAQLKLALTELQEDLKDKENSIEESQKLCELIQEFKYNNSKEKEDFIIILRSAFDKFLSETKMNTLKQLKNIKV